MEPEPEPELVISGLSRDVEVEGGALKVRIYRRESEADWQLEVLDLEGTPHVWEGTFDTDEQACAQVSHVLARLGV